MRMDNCFGSLDIDLTDHKFQKNVLSCFVLPIGFLKSTSISMMSGCFCYVNCAPYQMLFFIVAFVNLVCDGS